MAIYVNFAKPGARSSEQKRFKTTKEAKTFSAKKRLNGYNTAIVRL